MRTIVITGATRGLGRALAEKFMELGHRVCGCGRDGEKVGEMNARFAGKGFFVRVDVTVPLEVKIWADEVVRVHGAPDLLVNNAAIMNPLAPLWETDDKVFADMLAVNVTGVFNTIKAFVPAMLSRRSGIIVSLSSGWGRSTDADVGPYCTTKWAVEGLSRSLADDLPAGMASIPLNPGIIDTDMLRSCWGKSAAAYPSPADWAERTAPFLLSLNASHNGQPLTVPN